jgi:hypothetical protein
MDGACSTHEGGEKSVKHIRNPEGMRPLGRPSSRCEVKVKYSRYTSWKHLVGEEVMLLLIHDLGTGWG